MAIESLGVDRYLQNDVGEDKKSGLCLTGMTSVSFESDLITFRCQLAVVPACVSETFVLHINIFCFLRLLVYSGAKIKLKLL